MNNNQNKAKTNQTHWAVTDCGRTSANALCALAVKRILYDWAHNLVWAQSRLTKYMSEFYNLSDKSWLYEKQKGWPLFYQHLKKWLMSKLFVVYLILWPCTHICPGRVGSLDQIPGVHLPQAPNPTVQILHCNYSCHLPSKSSHQRSRANNSPHILRWDTAGREYSQGPTEHINP